VRQPGVCGAQSAVQHSPARLTHSPASPEAWLATPHAVVPRPLCGGGGERRGAAATHWSIDRRQTTPWRGASRCGSSALGASSPWISSCPVRWPELFTAVTTTGLDRL